MGLTDPYRLQNYMGEYSAETGVGSVLEFIQANRWDSDGDGTGTPQEGMMFYNTSNDVMAVYVNSQWIAMNSLWTKSGTVLSPLTSSDTVQVGAGNATAPGFAFSSDPNTGAFRDVDDNAADMFGVTTGGTSRFEVSASYLKSNVAYRGTVGSASAPSITFFDDPDTGFYRAVDGGSDDLLGISTGGVARLTISETDQIVSALRIKGVAGTAASPAFSFSSDTNTGLFRDADANGDDMLGVSTAGVSRFEVSENYLKSNVAYRGIEGSIAAPSVSFYGNADSGIFSDTANNKYFAVSANGTQTLAISGTRAWDVDTAVFNLDGTSLSLDATSSSNFTVTGTSAVDLTISATSTGGDARVLVLADSEIDLTANNIDLNATNALSIDGTSFSIDGTTSSNVSVTGTSAVDLTISATSTGGDADVDISATKDITFNARGATAPIPINSAADSDLETIAQNIVGAINELNDAIAAENLWNRSGTTLNPHTTGDIVAVGSGSATTPAYSFTSDKDTGLYNSSANTLGITVGGGVAGTFSETQVYLKGGDHAEVTIDNTSGIALSATDGIVNIDGADGIDVDTPKSFTVDAGEAISLDSAATSNFTVTEANLTLSTVTSGGIEISSVGTLDALSVDVLNLGTVSDKALTIKQNNEARFLAAAGGDITITPAIDSDLTLQVTDSLVAAPKLNVNAVGAGAELNFDSEFRINFVYEQLSGSGYFRISQNSNLILDMNNVGSVAWTPPNNRSFSVTTGGSGGDISFTSSGTGNITANSGGTAMFVAAGQFSLGSTSLSNVYFSQNSETRMWFNTSGSVIVTPASGQDFTVATGGVGDINLTSNADLVATFNDGAAGSSFTVVNDTTTIGTFSGNITMEPLSNFQVDTSTNGSGYTIIDGVYYVNGSNTSTLASILANLTAATHIVLGPGTHNIGWTTAQTMSYPVKITGSGRDSTYIYFTSSDADCCLNFADHVHISDVSFQRTTSMTNQGYAINITAPYSTIERCTFKDVDPQNNASLINISNTLATDVTLRDVSFEGLNAPNGYYIRTIAMRTTLDNIFINETPNTNDAIYFVTGAQHGVITNSYISCSTGTNANCNVLIEANDVKISNTNIVAGATTSSNHNMRLLTVTGDRCTVNACEMWANGVLTTATNVSAISVTGGQFRLTNSNLIQYGLYYTNTSSTPPAGMIDIDGHTFVISNNYLASINCKATIRLASSSADYGTISGNRFNSFRANASGTDTYAYGIWANASADKITVIGNQSYTPSTYINCYFLRTAAYVYDWTVIGNTVAKSAGSKGIYTTYIRRSVILGNTDDDATLNSVVAGSSATAAQYGTSGTTYNGGANG